MHKILVVDDEPQIVELLEELLRKWGFEAMTAADGEKAIEIIRSGEKINLMILDIKMPGITGVGVLKEMRRLNRKIPVIILSGSLDLDTSIDDLKKMGYNNIVNKPIDLFALLDMIKKELGEGAG
ncbi:MAG: response regulator [Candidatus Omnitrophota bacterium]